MRKFLKLFNSHPMRLVLTIILAFVLYEIMPYQAKQFFLGVSLSLKEILMFFIPLIIFSSVYIAFVRIRGNAISFMVLLLASVILSNFISINIAGIFSYFLVFSGDTSVHKPISLEGLEPLWRFSLPKLVSNNIVLLIALFLACIHIRFIDKKVSKFAHFAAKIVDIFLKKFFIPLLPLFIFGFLLKLLHDDIIMDIISVNPHAFIFMFIVLFGYLSLIFFSVVYFYKKKAKDLLKNIAAPAITAFTTMSSAAALPFSIKAAEVNTKNKNVSDVVIPATVNIHMIGDTICIPIIALILLMAFAHPMPSLYSYTIFAFAFVITKFSGAGVPGGSILIMLPVLEQYLGFNAEMTALITICYMLLDPICTSGNVIGNNLFVIHFTKLYDYIKSKQI